MPQILSRSSFGAYDFQLMTHQAVHIAMLGPVPVGAWIPFPGSQVTLSDEPSQFPQDPSIPSITERYPATIGYDNGNGPNGQTVPLGDFLGPNIVLWSGDPVAQMPETPLKAPTHPGVITALMISNSTFSLRVAAVPLTNRDFVDTERSDLQYPNPRQPSPFLRYVGQGRGLAHTGRAAIERCVHCASRERYGAPNGMA